MRHKIDKFGFGVCSFKHAQRDGVERHKAEFASRREAVSEKIIN